MILRERTKKQSARTKVYKRTTIERSLGRAEDAQITAEDGRGGERDERLAFFILPFSSLSQLPFPFVVCLGYQYVKLLETSTLRDFKKNPDFQMLYPSFVSFKFNSKLSAKPMCLGFYILGAFTNFLLV